MNTLRVDLLTKPKVFPVCKGLREFTETKKMREAEEEEEAAAEIAEELSPKEEEEKVLRIILHMHFDSDSEEECGCKM